MVVNSSKYWVAGHITGIFEIKDENPDILQKGSRGAGFSIKKGVFTEVQKSPKNRFQVFFNNVEQKLEEAQITNSVIEEITNISDINPVSIYHNFEIPLSSGFGASAAGALGTTLALNDFFDLNLPQIQLFQIAHKVEVINHCGLGDIIGLFQGGLELRIKAGAPGIGETKPMSNDEDLKIATFSLGPIRTSTVLGDSVYRRKISKQGKELTDILLKNPTFKEFGVSAEKFTESIGLLSERLGNIYSKIERPYLKGQIMIGEGIFVLYSKQRISEELAKIGFIPQDICFNTVKKI